jgi:hypothetical protein
MNAVGRLLLERGAVDHDFVAAIRSSAPCPGPN